MGLASLLCWTGPRVCALGEAPRGWAGSGRDGMEKAGCCQKRRTSERESAKDRGYWVRLAAAASSPFKLLRSLSLHRSRFPSCPALSHLFQIIIRLGFANIYCLQLTEEWRRGETNEDLT